MITLFKGMITMLVLCAAWYIAVVDNRKGWNVIIWHAERFYGIKVHSWYTGGTASLLS